tara:strand:+ start:6840 stop:7049 length:210 start_codon:yes stop_codon:yes gene_type:complete
MPERSRKKSKPKKTSIKDVKDTSRAKRGCPMPMTKFYVDVESGIKKDKEVKEKDVFNFSYSKNQNSVRK